MSPPPTDLTEKYDEGRERLIETWRPPKGWRHFSAVNNDFVGLWYTSASLLFFLFGGVLALLMRTQLAVPENSFLGPELYNQLFTLHGSIMMFLFAVPIFEAVSILLMPEMLGARDLPFPRLSAFGFWCFVIGGVFVCGSIFFNAAPQGGWFMYPPLTTAAQEGVGADIWLLGLGFIEIASIAAAVELIVGILRCRPPGMRINMIPLYAWYILVVGVMIVFAFPPLIAGDILLEIERAFDWPFFDAARGGDPLLWQHLFWIFGHPEVYIVFLPSIALIATMVPTFARTKMVGYGWIVLAAVGTGFLSFGLWVHHMYTTGLPSVSLGFFSAASVAVAIPTGVQIFCFIATLLAGKVMRSVPLLFVFGGLATFVLGGITGVMVALAPFDFQAHDSHFIVAHLHAVLIGGTVLPILGGIHYYYPLVRAKKLSERVGRVSFWLMFVGFNVTFLPMHLTGLRGMPRRVFTYADGLGLGGLNLVSSLGAGLLGLGFALFVWDVVRPRRNQPYSERNPWGAAGLEWTAEMPDQPWGIRTIPEIDSRYPLWDQPDFMGKVDRGEFFLPDAPEYRRETIVTSVIDARPLQVLRVPGPTWKTMFAAALTGGAFIAATFHAWWVAGVSGAGAVAAIWWWLWTGTSEIPEKPEKDAGMGITLPLYAAEHTSVGWWGMLITMLADLTAYVSLVFGYFFYWTVNEDFPPAGIPDPDRAWLLGGGALLLVAWGLTLAARRLNRADRGGWYQAALAAGLGAGLAGAAALLGGPWVGGMDPTSHAYAAIAWILVGWTAVHAAVGALMQAYCMAGRILGKIDARHDIDLENVALYWHFVAIMAAGTVAVLVGFPLVS